jgi:hypothetical protein
MKITAITGSYRRRGVIDSAVEEILEAASANGADVEKINLLDRSIEFCDNCRLCTLEEGRLRGKCKIADDLPSILERLEASDLARQLRNGYGSDETVHRASGLLRLLAVGRPSETKDAGEEQTRRHRSVIGGSRIDSKVRKRLRQIAEKGVKTAGGGKSGDVVHRLRSPHCGRGTRPASPVQGIRPWPEDRLWRDSRGKINLDSAVESILRSLRMSCFCSSEQNNVRRKTKDGRREIQLLTSYFLRLTSSAQSSSLRTRPTAVFG